MAGYAVLTCQWLLAAVFVVAVGSKLSRRAFREFVAATGRLLPGGWSGWRRPVAAGVVVAEVAVVGLLAWPVTAVTGPAGFGLALVLSAGFSTGIAAALRRGERAPCRCFGDASAPLGPGHLVRNGVLATVALAGLVLGWLPAPAAVPPAGAGLAGLVGLVLAALVVRMDDLVALFVPMST